MKIIIHRKALKYLEERQAEDISITLAEIDTNCPIGTAKEIRVILEKPQNLKSYRWKKVDKYHFFIDRRLREIGPIVLKKQGFWKFSSLYVEGLQVPL